MQEIPRVRVEFRDICFRVNIKRKDDEGKKIQAEKTILNNISASILPGETLVTMGPTGSGKTTLLDSVAGKIGSGTLTGDVLINGSPIDRATQGRFLAYVQQFDSLIPTLTVRETLMYSTKLTLPAETTPAQRETSVTQVIDELGLQGVADSWVGGGMFQGISNGQRKRVSMGIELVTRPSLMFLDEPTTGLDSAASYQVMQKITQLAAGGRSMMATIHQPSSAMYELFDKLLLLSAGRLVYFGSARDALDFFNEIEYPVPVNTNPADHFLDVISTDYNNTAAKELPELSTTSTESAASMALTDDDKHNDGGDDADDAFANGPPDIDRICEQYRASATGKAMLSRTADSTASAHASLDFAGKPYATSVLSQTGTLLSRMWLVGMRNPLLYWARFAMYTVMGIVLGVLYLDVGETFSAVGDRSSVIFFCVAFLTFMQCVQAPILIEEREVFVRERGNGAYSPLAYVIANTLISLPWTMLTSLGAAVPIYYLIGLNAETGRFGIFLVVLFLALYVSETIVMVLSSLMPVALLAITLGAGINGFFIITCGFFKAVVPPWYIWGQKISYQSYAFNAMMYNDFNGITLTDPRNANFTMSGEQFIAQRFNITKNEVVLDIGVLVAMAVIYRLMFAFFLWKFNTGKK